MTRLVSLHNYLYSEPARGFDGRGRRRSSWSRCQPGNWMPSSGRRLCADLGITSEPRPDHAQYIAQYLIVLKEEGRAKARPSFWKYSNPRGFLKVRCW